jgi:23S rRNA pseudouridine1911/1915/1917 synthase
MKHFEFTVTDEYAGERIDKCISELYEDFSRSYIQKLIKDNLVNVSPNKENCELSKSVKGSYILKEGNFVFFDTKESIIPDIVPEDIPLDILYEDSDVLVVNKPKGMVVHPAPGHYSNTLVNAVMFHVKDLSGINGVLRPGIVHRIDMNTTGSLIICKNDKAHIDIAAQLKEHSINRLYRAIVHGVINEDEGTVNKPIGRNEKDRKKMACNVANSKMQ